MTKDSTLRVAWPSNLDIKTIKEQPIEITGLSSKQRTEDLPSYGELSLQSLRRKRLTSQQGTKKKYIYQQHFIFYRFSKVISLLIYSLLGLESWYPFLVAKKTDKSLYLVSPLLPPPPPPFSNEINILSVKTTDRKVTVIFFHLRQSHSLSLNMFPSQALLPLAS